MNDLRYLLHVAKSEYVGCVPILITMLGLVIVNMIVIGLATALITMVFHLDMTIMQRLVIALVGAIVVPPIKIDLKGKK